MDSAPLTRVARLLVVLGCRNIDDLVVVNDEKVLVGIVDLQDLLKLLNSTRKETS